MKEIEVKIIGINAEEVVARLQALGAEKHFDGEMHAIFYDSSFQALGRNKSVLRVRKEGAETALTFKRQISNEDAKIMDEQEVKVSDMETMCNILEGIGFTKYRETHKTRVEYVLHDTKIVFDKYMGELAFIPVFLEIEAPNITRLYEVVELLKFDKQDCRNWNTYDLIKYYQN